MEARAVARYTRISPRKVRLVADLVRGKNVAQALHILALTPKRGSGLLRKTILSAVANARYTSEGDEDLQHESLLIKEIRIDVAPTLKRIRPRAQGRAYRIFKRMSHIRVTLGSDA
jgi:large subunit ribosomal protein L22